MREEYLRDATQYKDKLEPFMTSLIANNQWKLISRKQVERYSFDKNGVVFVYEVL